ncbi:MAG: hypothetical protein AAFV88_22305 [Planctomycetota bacterium]
MSQRKPAHLEPGQFLPGCSLAISIAESRSIHAFDAFRTLSFDGLDNAAEQNLAKSFTEVAAALEKLHTKKTPYGRITLQSFHNRGSETRPEATLWFDNGKTETQDEVHAGDAEAMYWRPQRLQHGEPPQPIDDWYALAVVLAEIHLTPAAVQSIWEHSQQEGDFVKRLQKNLRRSRRGPFRRFALDLLKMAEHGEPEEKVIAQWSQPKKQPQRPWGWAVAVAAGLAIAWLVYERSDAEKQREQSDQQLTELAQDLEKSRETVGVLESKLAQASLPPLPVTEPDQPVKPATNQDQVTEQWTDSIGGRSLEDAIEKSSAFKSDEALRYREVLKNLVQLPGQVQWRRSDAKFRRLVQKTVDAPWNASIVQETNDRAESLGEAYARWLRWSQSTRPIDEIKTQQQLMPSGAVKDLLGSWLADLLSAHDFELTCTLAVIPTEDQDWVAYRMGFETSESSGEVDWELDAGGKGTRKTTLSVKDFDAGQALSVWLTRDSSIPLWDKTVLQHTLNGPLLLWRLSRSVRLKSDTTGYQLDLSTNKRIGPPAKLETVTLSRESGTETSGAVGHSSQPIAAGEVDPKDLLPFSND